MKKMKDRKAGINFKVLESGKEVLEKHLYEQDITVAAYMRSLVKKELNIEL